MLKIPDDLRVASPYDLVDPDGIVLPGVKFWVHTFHSDELEEHETKKKTQLNRWDPWFNENRVYVKKAALTKPTKTLNYI